jgi:hypothetical protein
VDCVRWHPMTWRGVSVRPYIPALSHGPSYASTFAKGSPAPCVQERQSPPSLHQRSPRSLSTLAAQSSMFNTLPSGGHAEMTESPAHPPPPFERSSVSITLPWGGPGNPSNNAVSGFSYGHGHSPGNSPSPRQPGQRLSIHDSIGEDDSCHVSAEQAEREAEHEER